MPETKASCSKDRAVIAHDPARSATHDRDRAAAEKQAGAESDERYRQLFTSSDADYQAFLTQGRGTAHPERYVLGKPHPDRARQFKPFAALRGYEELVAQVMEEANEPHDFAGLEESC